MALFDVTFHTIGGEFRTLQVWRNVPLRNVAVRTGDVFGKPRHLVKLVSDKTMRVVSGGDEYPFLFPGDTLFTVVFSWKSQWEPGLGQLPALSDTPAHAKYDYNGVDKQYQVSSYTTPYTKSFQPGYSMNFTEIVSALTPALTQMIFHPARMPPNLVLEVMHARRCKTTAKLTPTMVRKFLRINMLAKSSIEFPPSCREVFHQLDLFLQGTGLEVTRRRYRQKSKPRPTLSLETRLRTMKRKMM